MNPSLRVTVAGAGVFGLATALALLEREIEVLIVDPQTASPNASVVAAGLLAPVGEAIFDPDAAAHYPLMAEALRLWAGFAVSAGVTLSDDGLIVPVDAGPALATLGVPAEAHPAGLFVQADPRVLEPPSALQALRTEIAARGGAVLARAVTAADWRAADLVVLATGAGVDGPIRVLAHAPELRRLTPVKGQIAVLPNGPASGPTIRWPGGYLAPQPGGARVGATMELGRCDTGVEPGAVAQLIAAAERYAPGLDRRGAFGQAGVRVQTADALPLVGPSTGARTLLATGARRNGWLFAPLVGRMIAAYCKGEDPGPWAAMLHPARFDRG
jgi:glycine oxidase